MSDMIRIWPYCFFSLSRLTVNFSILMSRIQSIWPWPVSTRGRHWGGFEEGFAYQGGGEGGGGGVPPGASSHLSWSLASSQLCAAVIQYRNTRICCHWKRSLFPVTSELKFPHHFCKKNKNTVKGSRCKRKKSSECDWKWGMMTFICLNTKNSFAFCWGRKTSSTVPFQSTQGTKSVIGGQDMLTCIRKNLKTVLQTMCCLWQPGTGMLSNSLQFKFAKDLECKFKTQIFISAAINVKMKPFRWYWHVCFWYPWKTC